MRVKIYKPVKTATQSGRGKSKDWILEYELSSDRKPENLMGWTASGDTCNQVRLAFSKLDDAVKYANNEGWDYTILSAHERKICPRSYADNFIYRPVEKGA